MRGKTNKNNSEGMFNQDITQLNTRGNQVQSVKLHVVISWSDTYGKASTFWGALINQEECFIFSFTGKPQLFLLYLTLHLQA